ncbi:MAG: lysoplasmalogenase [Bacteroidia bacterium]|jgi:uncharacterized membrane protein YhhN
MRNFIRHKFIFAFITIVLLVLLANITGNLFLDIVFKPLIVISLLVYLFASGGHKEKAARLAVGGLAFSCLGDVLLIFQGRHGLFFIGGLVSFLIAHLLYIAYYVRSSGSMPEKTLKGKYIYFLVILIYGTTFYTVLYNNLGDLRLPVAIYTAVLMGMNIFALNRYGRVNERSFIFVMTGALFFTLSDSLLALNKFLFPLPLAGLWIMITYSAAQYLITEGVVCSSDKARV